MKLIISIVIATTFLFSFNLKAQNLGYLGKKLSIDIGASVSPSFTNSILGYPKAYYDPISSKLIRLDLKPFSISLYPELNISYTLNKRVSFAVRLGYQRFRLYYNDQLTTLTDTTYSWDLITYSIDAYDAHFNLLNASPISQTFITEFSIRITPRRYISPIGPYFTIGFGSYFSKLTEGDTLKGNLWNSYPNNSNSYILEEFTIKNTWNSLKRLTFGYHMKKAYKNAFYTDFGIEMSLSTNNKYKNKYDNTKNGLSYIQYAYIQNQQRRYLIWENLYAVKVSVGKIF